jgi:hypothetical protein
MKKDIERYIKKFGSVASLKKEISKLLEEFTMNDNSLDNINQIVYWSKMLLKLKNEY